MHRAILSVLLSGAAALPSGCATTRAAENGADLHAAVVQRLALDPRTDQSRLTVREEAGVVTIAGFIGTLEERLAVDRAAADIDGLDGVRRVDVRVSMIAGSRGD